MKRKNLKEGLQYEDLRGLVDNTFSVDQYKPKIGSEDETVVVAFTVTYEEPAKDLSTFIETSPIEHLDVEASTAPESDGSYRVFVEFTRDFKLYEKLENLLRDIDQITSKDDGGWNYIAFKSGGKESEFNKENFKRDVVDSAVEYRMKYLDKTTNEEIERLKKLVKY